MKVHYTYYIHFTNSGSMQKYQRGHLQGWVEHYMM